jgi:restriction system protein
MPYVLPSESEYVPHIKPEVKLIDRLREIDWFQFERFVAYLYEKRGYNVTRKGGANPDGGIDLVIEKDGEKFAVQCKHWKSWNVGVKAIREFLGALTDSKIQKGIFITLEGYSGDAKQLADKHGIEIINETGLRRLAEGLDFGDPKIVEIFSDTRKICPKCEQPLVKRIANKGPNAGGQFWGCSTYPRCHFTMPA